MAYRTLEITLISAKDLKDVNIFSKMEVYAVAALAGDSRTKQRTPVDKEGGKNPSWNYTLRFTVPDHDSGRLVLHILLRSERILGDRDVGEVHVPLNELIDAATSADGDEKKPAAAAQFVTYQVRKPNSGNAKGVLNLSYKFGDLVTASSPPVSQNAGDPVTAYPPPEMKAPKADEPVTAYPVTAGTSYPPYAPQQQPGYGYPPPPPQAGYGYHPPPQQAGYGYPPPPHQAGYGYPPPQGGYGYPPPQGGYGYPQPQGGYGYPPAGPYGYGGPPPAMAQPAKKNKFGMGLGAGLLGGAIGGMILGDMVSDAGAYDAGFDDGIDF